MLLNIRRRISRAWEPALVILILAYFSYHAIEGHHGLLALRELNTQLADLEIKAQASKTERAALEGKVSSLRRDNLDLDLLDERARAILGYSEAGEVVLFTNPQ